MWGFPRRREHEEGFDLGQPTMVKCVATLSHYIWKILLLVGNTITFNVIVEFTT